MRQRDPALAATDVAGGGARRVRRGTAAAGGSARRGVHVRRYLGAAVVVGLVAGQLVLSWTAGGAVGSTLTGAGAEAAVEAASEAGSEAGADAAAVGEQADAAAASSDGDASLDGGPSADGGRSPDQGSEGSRAGGLAGTGMRFEANQGQYPPSVHFVARTGSYTLALTDEGAVFALPGQPNSGEQTDEGEHADGGDLTGADEPAAAGGAADAEAPRGAEAEGDVVGLAFDGAAAEPTVEGIGRLPGVTNYLVGPRSEWHTGIPSFARVRYEQVWPGVDVVVYATEAGEVEYDFELAPGADPKAIGLTVEGADGVRRDDDGALVIDTAAGPLRQSAPELHQPTSDGGSEPVAGRFVVTGDRVGFAVGAYDPSRRLVIDPVVSFAATLEGGSLAVDGEGRAYKASDTPTWDDGGHGPLNDVAAALGADAAYEARGLNLFEERHPFVARLAADGSALDYLTYVSGTDDDRYIDLAVDAGTGRAYLVGDTTSLDFPTTEDAYQQDPRQPCLPKTARKTLRMGVGDSGGSIPSIGLGGQRTPCTSDGFLAVLTPDGGGVDYATYLSGSERDSVTGVAVEADGTAAVTGETFSGDFPVTDGAHDTACGSDGDCDATAYPDWPERHIPPTHEDEPHRHAKEWWSHVKGLTNPQDREARWSDAFVAKIDPEAAGEDSLVFSTYLGGAWDDHARGSVYVGASGALYVSGKTYSGSFPTPNGLRTERSTCPDERFEEDGSKNKGCEIESFLAVVAADGSEVLYGTYLDLGGVSAVGPAGQIYLVRESAETGEWVLTRLDPQASGDESLVSESVVLAGESVERASGLAVDAAGYAYLTGWTEGGLSKVGPPQPGYTGGRNDGFVVKADSEDPGEDAVMWASYLGTSGSDRGFEIVLPPDQAAGSGKLPVGPASLYLSMSVGQDDEFFSDADGRRAQGSFVVKLEETAEEAAGGGSGGVAPPQPHVSGLAPVGGPPTGGTPVTISGDNLAEASEVRFGDAAVECGSSRCDVSGSQVVVDSPPHEPGVVEVRLTVGGEELSAGRFVYGRGAWEPVGAPPTPVQEGQTTTLLDDGRVLLVGGGDANDGPAGPPSVYDPQTGAWEQTGAMRVPRRHHTATLLASGKVLVAGGEGFDTDGDRALTATAEVYDPDSGDTGEWTLVGEMGESVHSHAAARLQSGEVLVVGGCAQDVQCDHARESPPPHAEVYDPDTGEWSDTGEHPVRGDGPAHGRAYPSLTVLDDGRALAVGGLKCGHEATFEGTREALKRCQRAPQDDLQELAPTEVYDPGTGEWSEPAQPAIARFSHTAVRLATGEVMVAGGDGGSDETELFDPEAGDDGAWRAARGLGGARVGHVAAVLADGRVLAAGGTSGGGRDLQPEVELFDRQADEDTGAWRPAVPSPPGFNGTKGGALRLPGLSAVVLSADADEFTADATVCAAHCGKVFMVSPGSEQAWLFTPPPTVDEVTPGEGPSAGGTQVTISGTGFTHGSTRVSFGPATVECPSPSCQVDAYDQLTVTAPPVDADGPVEVVVTTKAGRSPPEASGVFSYRRAPGRVDLSAEAVSGEQVRLSWPAVSDGRGGVATDYIITQASAPIEDEGDFAAAQSLCGEGACQPQPAPQAPGDPVSVDILDLSPGTTYHYAVRAVAHGQQGPISDSAAVTTPGDSPGGGDADDEGAVDTDGDGVADAGGDGDAATDAVGDGTDGTPPAEAPISPADGDEPARAACDPAAVPDVGFSDTGGRVHEHAVACVAWYGLALGLGDTTGDGQVEYGPRLPVTRAQMASFIARLAVEAGVALPDATGDAFGDDNGSVHEDAINQLASLGLVQGTGEGRYALQAPVTRDQMASFLVRLHEQATGSGPAAGEDAFGDDDGSVHEGAINDLAALGVTQGRGDPDGDGRADYGPRQPVSREQMASFIARELGVLVQHGVAYQGGAQVSLARGKVGPGEALPGQVATHKQLVRVVVDGCGLAERELPADGEGRFAVPVPADQPPGDCQLAVAATTTRPGGAPDAPVQTAVYGFPLTIQPHD